MFTIVGHGLSAILSPRHANALVPIELANALASLATYPAAPVLTRFIDDALQS
jgi:hypothetical protein